MKKSLPKVHNQGFTLIEILIVIGIIAILAAIVLVAINPARQFRQANNTQRESNVNAILNAIGGFTVDSKGTLPSGIPSSPTTADVGTICGNLVTKFIPALPTDPDSANKGASIDCGATSMVTGYKVTASSTTGRVTVTAPLAKDVDTGNIDASLISVTR